jgi:hypothetical protein
VLGHGHLVRALAEAQGLSVLVEQGDALGVRRAVPPREVGGGIREDRACLPVLPGRERCLEQLRGVTDEARVLRRLGDPSLDVRVEADPVRGLEEGVDDGVGQPEHSEQARGVEVRVAHEAGHEEGAGAGATARVSPRIERGMRGARDELEGGSRHHRGNPVATRADGRDDLERHGIDLEWTPALVGDEETLGTAIEPHGLKGGVEHVASAEAEVVEHARDAPVRRVGVRRHVLHEGALCPQAGWLGERPPQLRARAEADAVDRAIAIQERHRARAIGVVGPLAARGRHDVHVAVEIRGQRPLEDAERSRAGVDPLVGA